MDGADADLLSRSGEIGCGSAAPCRGAGNCATSHDGAAAGTPVAHDDYPQLTGALSDIIEALRGAAD
ncbi:hypothetical protein ACH4TV_45420 [Streptomyces sp. NPDC020898]|uniref:hypothetical protein n=1 Tax=Streptomyces sp. NPDC020898 TaxID=3365101 RepID=UPI0037B6656C